MQELARQMLTQPLRLMQIGVRRVASLGGSQVGPPSVTKCPRRESEGVGAAPGDSFDRKALNRAVLTWMSNAFGWESLSQSANSRSMVDVIARSPELLEFLVPGTKSRVAWQEAGNKLQAYFRFTNADRAVGLVRQRRGDLPELVHGLNAMAPYSGLWATEGLGYYYATAALQAIPRRTNLLTDATGELSQRHLIPLHTGMGLAFAMRQLHPLSPSSHEVLVRQRLDEFLGLCHANSREGYFDAAVEQLGLIARLLRPRLIPMLERELANIDSNHVGTFWHGIGRAIYFTPTNVLPCGSVVWPGLRKAQSEPPHEIGRVNAMAGFAWAVTLVNIRHPEVLEMLLRRHADELGESKAFGNGVSSAMAVWQDWAPDSPYLDNLCRYQPRQLKPAALRQWEFAVRSRCSGAVACQDDVLNCQRRGDLFRYSQPNQ